MKKQGQIIKSKFEQVYDNLLERIKNEFHAGDHLPTEAELASAMNVSRVTVSKAMSVLKQEGYVRRRQGLGTILNVKPGKIVPDGMITVLPADIAKLHDNFFKTVADAVAEEVFSLGLINTSLGGALNDGKILQRINELYSGGRYSGVVLVNTLIAEYEAWRAYYRERPEPRSVWIGMSPKLNPNVNCVGVDQAAGILLGLDFLLAQGYRRIGFLSHSPDTYDRQERLEAFKRIHAEKGLALNDERIIVVQQAQGVREAGYLGFKRLSESKEKFDALFLADCGLLEGLEELQKENHAAAKCSLPMAAFDYRFGGAFDHLVLASVIQPIKDLGRAAVKMLTQLYAGKVMPPLRTVLKPIFLLRPKT